MIDVKLQDAVHDDRLLLDSLETANALRISRRHLLNLAKNRRFLAPLKLGNRTLWNKREVQAFLDAGAPSDAAAWQADYRESQGVTA